MEHGDAGRSLGHHRQHLHRGGTRTDDANPLAGIVNAFLRPARGVEQRALETVHALDLRDHGLGNHAHAADEVLGSEDFAGGRFHFPDAAVLNIAGLGDLGVELDMRPHVAAVSDETHVAVGFLPARIALGPLPFLQQFLREGQAVVIAFAIGGGTGIAVPRPGAADVRCLVEDADRKARLAHVMDQRQPGEARTDGNHVEIDAFACLRHGLVVRLSHQSYSRTALWALVARGLPGLRRGSPPVDRVPGLQPASGSSMPTSRSSAARSESARHITGCTTSLPA